MIAASARDRWRELETELRPFVARRVRAPHDVDDVVQDVFLKIQRGLGALKDDERFGPWVYRVARSAIADHLRDRARHPLSDDASVADEPADAEPADPPLDDDDRAAERRLASAVAPFIAMLPSPYREALTLTELEGLTQREAAELVGITLSGMKSRVQRGRRELKRALEDCCAIALDARGKVVDCTVRRDGRLPDDCCR